METEQGYAFIPVFKYLRLQYIISDLASARIIERDSLIPAGKNGVGSFFSLSCQALLEKIKSELSLWVFGRVPT